jgi:site-specific recombinase XerD
MGDKEVNKFLSHMAVKEHISASTQNQALCAIIFFYRHVLNKDIGLLEGVVCTKRPQKIPVVLTKQEVKSVLSFLDVDKRLMAIIMYDAGLRLMECLRLRIKDVDFSSNQILVREGKGNKDRLTMLPGIVKQSLIKYPKRVKQLHQRDLREGFGRGYIPYTLERKYPKAAGEWAGSMFSLLLTDISISKLVVKTDIMFMNPFCSG